MDGELSDGLTLFFQTPYNYPLPAYISFKMEGAHLTFWQPGDIIYRLDFLQDLFSSFTKVLKN